jgi:hypothetical protein
MSTPSPAIFCTIYGFKNAFVHLSKHMNAVIIRHWEIFEQQYNWQLLNNSSAACINIYQIKRTIVQIIPSTGPTYFHR